MDAPDAAPPKAASVAPQLPDTEGELCVAGLTPALSRRLAAAALPLRLARGDTVFGPGDPGDVLFVVVRGRVRLERRAEGAREYAPSLLGPGDVFGELTVFDPSPRGATARALTDTELLSIGSAPLRRWLAAEPDAAWQLLGHLARRLRGAHAVTQTLLADGVPARIARTLLEFGARFGERTPAGLLVRHGLTQSELALHTGVSRGSVNRVLTGFAGLRLLRVESRAVLITDTAGLREQAGQGTAGQGATGQGSGGKPA
ncbi:Crp/Fnr family transcriptional regulator [Streptomyces sp. NPDC059063]|uniref:Crp/Fnr family transcriptional regulator n=1 Tax=unclassified Streptomyces TaxID=2593676 RepID=UPI0036C948FE